MLAVGIDDHRHRIPANDRADAPFDLVVSWRARLEMRRNRVDVGGVGGERYERDAASRFFDQPFEQVVRALGDRKSAVLGKSGSVRVDLGGRLNIKKKKKK